MGIELANIISVSKSRYSDIRDQESIKTACYAWRAVNVPIPIIRGDGKCLGWVIGDKYTHRSKYIPPFDLSTPFSDYDTLVATLSKQSKFLLFVWSKQANTTVAQNWYDFWPVGGTPGVGSYGGTARTAKQFSNTTAGAMWAGGVVTPSVKYLSRFSAFNTAGASKMAMLYDRVLTYETCTFTAGNQTMTNTLTAQRYVTSNVDPGLQMCMTADTVGNATAANLSQLRYSNQAGTTLQLMPTSPAVAKIVSPAAPTTVLPARVIAPGSATRTDTPFLPLANNDTGVQLVNDYTWSAAPTGTFCLGLVFPLALLPDLNPGVSADCEYISGVQGASRLTRVYDDACLSVMMWSANTNLCTMSGDLEIVWT